MFSTGDLNTPRTKDSKEYEKFDSHKGRAHLSKINEKVSSTGFSSSFHINSVLSTSRINSKS